MVGAVVAADCAGETKRLKAFQRGMRAAKRRFFRTHRSTQARKRFVKRQNRRLAALKRARRRCLARPPTRPRPRRRRPPPAPPAPAARRRHPPPPEPLATVRHRRRRQRRCASSPPGEVTVENRRGVRAHAARARADAQRDRRADGCATGPPQRRGGVLASGRGNPDGADPGSRAASPPCATWSPVSPAARAARTPTYRRCRSPIELPDIIDPSDVSPVRPQLASRARRGSGTCAAR